jgi:hypothetical protein
VAAQAPTLLMGAGRNVSRFRISTSTTCPVGTLRCLPSTVKASIVSATPSRRRYGYVSASEPMVFVTDSTTSICTSTSTKRR